MCLHKMVCSGDLQRNHIPFKRRRLEHGYRVWSTKEAIALWKEYASEQEEQEEVFAQLKHFKDFVSYLLSRFKI